MSSLRQIKKAVQWYDGMLLRPEHFQQADRRTDQLLQYHLQNSQSFFWGIRHLKLDDILLISGIFRILELEAVMSDGMPVSSYAEDGELLEIDLRQDPKLFEGNQEVTIYLAIPEYQPNAANMEVTFPRYRSVDSGTVVNENTGSPGVVFPCITPNLLLFAGEEPTSRFIFFPLAKVSRENQNFVLTPFSSPLLRVKCISPLGSLCSDIALKIRNKIAFLGERISADQTSIMAQQANDYMQTMSAALLPFEALFNIDGAHSFDLYVMLCALAGHLCALAPNQMPPGFEPYNHNDPRKHYEEVCHFINFMLERIQEGYFTIQFAVVDRLFSLYMPRPWFNQRLVFGAKATPGMVEKDLIEWVASCVIASERFVDEIRDKRILGAQRVIIEGDEEMKLIPSKDMILFEVTYDEAFINPGERLQMFNVADEPKKRPKDIIFYVAKKNFQT